MLVDVAHELRTPLTNIRGYLEALSDGVLPASPRTVELLLEETMRLAKLVESMLQLARAGAAASSLNLRPLDLRELVLQSLDLFASQLEEKGIEVETRLGGAGAVVADSDRLTQVLHNLLQNAWRYTPAGGKVTIAVEAAPGEVSVAVANTGEGIRPEDLPFVFERFFRGEKSRSRAHGGEGIGLAIVKELVAAHGGRVGAESAAGTTRVWFTLPA